MIFKLLLFVSVFFPISTLHSQPTLLPAGYWYPKKLLDLLQKNVSINEFDQAKKPIAQIIVHPPDSTNNVYFFAYNSEPFPVELKLLQKTPQFLYYQVKGIVFMEIFDKDSIFVKRDYFDNIDKAEFYMKYYFNTNKIEMIINGRKTKYKIEFLKHKNIYP